MAYKFSVIGQRAKSLVPRAPRTAPAPRQQTRTPQQPARQVWNTPDFRAAAVGSRGGPTVDRGAKIGDVLYYDDKRNIITSAQTTTAKPMFWDTEQGQAVLTPTPVPYRYTGENYSLINQRPVPIWKPGTSTFDPAATPGAPVYYDPWKNQYTTQKTDYPIYQSPAGVGQSNWDFVGFKPAIFTADLQQPNFVFQDPETQQTYIETDQGTRPVNYDPTAFTYMDTTAAGTRGLMSTVGASLPQNVTNFIKGLWTTVKGLVSSVQGANHVGLAWFDIPRAAVNYGLAVAGQEIEKQIKPKDQRIIGRELIRRGVADSGPGLTGWLAEQSAKSIFTPSRYQPVVPGTSEVIDDPENLRNAVYNGQVEWLDNKEWRMRQAAEMADQTRKYWSDLKDGRSLVQEEAEKFGYSYPGITPVVGIDPAGSLAQESAIAGKFIAERADQLTEEAFQTKDWQKRVDAIKLQRTTSQDSELGIFDPYFAYTWIGSPEKEQKFLESIAQIEMQIGRPLKFFEVVEARNAFVSPWDEMAGDVVFDLGNFMFDGLFAAGKAAKNAIKNSNAFFVTSGFVKYKFTNPLIEKIMSSSKVGRVIEWAGQLSTRSTANSIGRSANELFLSLAHNAPDTAKFYESVDELASAVSRGEVDFEKMASLPPEFAARQREITIKLGRQLSGSDDLAKMAGPETWADTVRLARDEVYEAAREEHFARMIAQGKNAAEAEELAAKFATDLADNPKNLTLNISQKFKDAYLQANRVQYRGVLGGLLKFEDRIRSLWTKAVLSARPAWVIRNQIDNAFRAMIFGINPFDALHVFDPDATIRIAGTIGIPPSLTEAMLRSELERSGKTIAQRFLEDWKPRTAWDLFKDNVKNSKPALDAALDAADNAPGWLSRLLKTGSAHLRNFGDNYLNTVSDWNAVVEYTVKIKMFEKQYYKNLAFLRQKSLEAALNMARSMGLGESALRAVQIAWQRSGENPARLRDMLDGLGLGSERFVAYFMPDNMDDLLRNVPFDQRAKFLDEASKRFRNYVEEFRRVNGRNPNPEEFDGFFNEFIDDFEDMRNAALNQVDTRDAEDLTRAGDVGEMPSPAPSENVVPSAARSSIFHDTIQTREDALAGLRNRDRDVKSVLTNFRDAVGSSADVRVADAPFGKPYEVSIIDGKVTLTFSPEIGRMKVREVRVHLRSAVGDIVRLKADLPDLMRARNYQADFLMFLNDPETLKIQARSVYDHFAKQFIGDPNIASLVNSISRRDYMKFLDNIPEELLDAEVADLMRLGPGGTVPEIQNFMSEGYRAAGAAQRDAFARLNDVGRRYRFGNEAAKADQINDVYATLGYFRDHMKKFLLNDWPGPLRHNFDLSRARAWDKVNDLGERIYRALAQVADEQAVKIAAGVSNEEFGITLDDMLRRVGIVPTFRQDGRLASFQVQNLLGNSKPASMPVAFRDRLLKSIFGSSYVDNPNTQKLFTSVRYSDRLISRLEGREFDEVMARIDDLFGANKKLDEIKKVLYDHYDNLDEAKRPPTFEEWQTQVNTFFTIENAMARPWMKLTGGTFQEFLDKYVGSVVSLKELPTGFKSSGAYWEQVLTRRQWLLKSRDVATQLPQSMKAKDLLNYMTDPKRGVKKAELEDMGIAPWLRAQGDRVISRDELVEMIDESAVVFVPGEKIRGADAPITWKQMLNDVSHEFNWVSFEADHVIIQHNYNRGTNLFFEVQDLAGRTVSHHGDLYDAQEAVRVLETGKSSRPTKWSQYVLPGVHKNYHEILLTTNPSGTDILVQKRIRMLESEYDSIRLQYKKVDQELSNIPYSLEGKVDERFDILKQQLSDLLQKRQELHRRIENLRYNNNLEHFTYDVHWSGDKDFFAHLRADERVNVDGQKIYHIEEIQSDLHQQGRKGGYRRDLTPEERGQILAKKEQIDGLLSEQMAIVESLTPSDISPRLFEIDKEIADTWDEIWRIEGRGKLGAVPDFPYKKNWHTIAFKRGLEEAVETGSDFITWTTGQQQFERWGSISVSWNRIDEFAIPPKITERDLIPIEDFLEDKRLLDDPKWRNKLVYADPDDPDTFTAHDLLPGETPIEGLARLKAERREGWDVKMVSPGFDPYNSDVIRVTKMDDLDMLPGEAGTEWKDDIWKEMQASPSGSYAPLLRGMQGFYDGLLPQDAVEYLRKIGFKDVQVEDVQIITDTIQRQQFPRPAGWLVQWQGEEQFYVSKISAQEKLKRLAADGYMARIVEAEEIPEIPAKYKYENVHGIKITPAMRESILQGQPLFQMEAANRAQDYLKASGNMVMDGYNLAKIAPEDLDTIRYFVDNFGDPGDLDMFEWEMGKLKDFQETTGLNDFDFDAVADKFGDDIAQKWDTKIRYSKTLVDSVVRKVDRRVTRGLAENDWWNYRVTHNQIEQLKTLGYPEDVIRKLKPVEAEAYTTYGVAYTSPAFNRPRSDNFDRWFKDSKVFNPVFHGTSVEDDFRSFAYPQFGYHFGTSDAAEDILRNKRSAYWFEDNSNALRGMPAAHERVGAYWLSVQNPIEMRDLGTWAPDMVVKELRDEGILSDTQWDSLVTHIDHLGNEVRGNILDGGNGLEEILLKYHVDPEDSDLLIQKLMAAEPDRRAGLITNIARLAEWGEIKKYLQDMGYDGVKYVNNYEGRAGEYSWIAFNKSQIKSLLNHGTFDAGTNDVLYQMSDEAGLRRYVEEEADRIYQGLAPSYLVEEAYEAAWKLMSGIEIRDIISEESAALASQIRDLWIGDNLRTLMPRYADDVKPLKGFKIVFMDAGKDVDVVKVLEGAPEGRPIREQFVSLSTPPKGKRYFAVEVPESTASIVDPQTVSRVWYGGSNTPYLNLEDPEFQRWFDRTSPLLKNADGSPKRFFHGTNEDFNAFDPSLSGTRGDTGWYGDGLYFTDRPSYAANYSGYNQYGESRPGGNVIPVYLNLKNPLDLRETDKIPPAIIDQLTDDEKFDLLDKYRFWDANSVSEAQNLTIEDIKFDHVSTYLKVGDWQNRAGSLRYSEIIRNAGYDGIVVSKGSEVVVFDPTQIKSIFNKGTFSRGTANILEQASSEIPQAAVKFGTDGKALVYLLQKSNISSIVHEFAHIYRRTLKDLAQMDQSFGDDLTNLLKWTGEKSWTVRAEEKFARAFERYLYDGIAPNASLVPAFSRMKAWMREVYGSIERESSMDLDLDRKVDGDKSVRDIFNSWFNYDTSAAAEPANFRDAVARDMGIILNGDNTMKYAPTGQARQVPRSKWTTGLLKPGTWRFNDELELTNALYADPADWTVPQIRKLVNQLRDVALVDEKTGVLNGRAYMVASQRVANNPNLFIVKIDVDGLASINDYSEFAGDNLLRAVAGEFTSQGHEIYRTGGDEFSIIVLADDAADAAAKMERVRSGLDTTIFDAPNSPQGRIAKPQFSYGVGKADDEAEAALTANKMERKAAGLRGVEDPADRRKKLRPSQMQDVNTTANAKRIPAPEQFIDAWKTKVRKMPGVSDEYFSTVPNDKTAALGRLDQARGIVSKDNLTGFKSEVAFAYGAPHQRVVYLNLEGMKFVNDLAGHEAGNEYIKSLARIIEQATDGLPGVSLYRFNADNFYIGIDDITQEAKILDKLDEAINGGISVKFGDREYKLRFAYAVGDTRDESAAGLKEWVGQLRTQGDFLTRDAAPAAGDRGIVGGPGEGERWRSWRDFDRRQIGGEVQGEEGARNWVPLTDDEQRRVEEVRQSFLRNQRREQTLSQLKGRITTITDPKLRAVAQLGYQDILDSLINVITDGQDVTAFLQADPRFAKLLSVLPDTDTHKVLMDSLKKLLAGESTNSNVAKALRELLVEDLEKGRIGWDEMFTAPHPYALESLGMEQNAVDAAKAEWLAHGLDPDTYLTDFVAKQNNATALWKSFIEMPWVGDQSISQVWGQFADDPDRFAAYLTDLIRALQTAPVSNTSLEALDLMRWQVKNFRAITHNFASTLNTSRIRMYGDSFIPMMPMSSRFSDAYKTWFAQANMNAASMEAMKNSLVTWKEELAKAMREGTLETNLSPEDIRGITGSVDGLVRMRQNLNDLAIYGGDPSVSKKIQDVMGFMVDDTYTKKMVRNEQGVGEWVPLDVREKSIIDTLVKDATEQAELIGQMGGIPEGALTRTNRFMIDYGNANNMDEIIRKVIPFWMFTSRSFPFWAETMLEHPEILLFYQKYIQYTKRVQYDMGITTSDGKQLPSLEGYIRIPGTEMWFNPTAPLSFRYVIPKFNAYMDENESSSAMTQVMQWMYEYSSLFGVSLSPMLTVAADAAGLLKNQPVGSIFPQAELLPRWWRQSLMSSIAKTTRDSTMLMAGARAFLGDRVPWSDYVVERRLLANGLEQMQNASTEAEKMAIANKIRSAIKLREDDPMWRETQLEIDKGDLKRAWGGYFTGMYAKEFTDGEIQLLAVRNEINALRDSINNELGAQLLELDPTSVSRYEHYQDVKYNSAEGLIHQIYNNMRYTQVPDLTEKDGFRQLTGDERRQYMLDKLYQEEITSAYRESQQVLYQGLQDKLIAIGVGASSEMVSKVYDWFYEEMGKIESNPVYDGAWRTWSMGYKPEELLYDHFRRLWWQSIEQGKPRYDSKIETYDEYQVRLEEWKTNLPSIVSSMAASFEAQLPKEFGTSVENYERNMRQKGVELPGDRTLNITAMIDRLKKETNYDGYTLYRQGTDNELDALDKAWEELYWNPYWDAVTGKSGYERVYAERKFLSEYSAPTDEELLSWVMDNYKGRFSPEELKGILEKAGTETVESRLAPQDENEQMAQEIWDILSFAGPNKDALQAAFENLGGYWSDVSTWYNVGGDPAAWDDPQKFLDFYNKMKLAAENAQIQEPDDATLNEWITAKRLDDELDQLYVSELGEDIMTVMGDYWRADTRTRRAMRKADKRIDQYYDLRDGFAAKYPVWAKYYLPSTESKSYSTSGSRDTATGSGYSSGGYRGSSYRRYSGGSSGSYTPTEYTLPMGYRSNIDIAKVPGYLGKGGYGGTLPIPRGLASTIGEAVMTELESGNAQEDTIEYVTKIPTRHPEYKPEVEKIVSLAGAGKSFTFLMM